MKPEERVRQDVIAKLRKAGWPEGRLQWKPEWRVPDTPHDISKREQGLKFATCGSCDLVAFADESGEAHALEIVFEFKAPDLVSGKQQLLRYLSNEPTAKMGYWTNGTDSVAIYKRHTSKWLHIPGAPLPTPFDDLTAPPDEPLLWADLETPTEPQLTAVMKRLLATVVVTDTRSTRREDQLREVTHVLLAKVESDAQARRHPTEPVSFQLYGDDASRVQNTAQMLRDQFAEYFRKQQKRLFHEDDSAELRLTDDTLASIVKELYPFRILGDDIDLLAKAFQVFRTAALRSKEGQYLTPTRVLKPCVMALDVRSSDKVIDPACGTGGFLMEVMRQVRDNEFPGDLGASDVIKFSNDNLYGVDVDALGVKLSRAMMVALGDGSTHVLRGDAVRTDRWQANYPHLGTELGSFGDASVVAEQFSVVVTNPPFGKSLKVKGRDLRASGYTIAEAASSKSGEFADLEVGLVYLELAHRLLQTGGRVGIVLPETYFFSFQYRWLPDWLKERFEMRMMLNIPMEAFEEFCRAKTNFYVFEKVGDGPSDKETDQ